MKVVTPPPGMYLSTTIKIEVREQNANLAIFIIHKFSKQPIVFYICDQKDARITVKGNTIQFVEILFC